MAKPSGLSAKQLVLLGRLNRLPALGGFYLAGGSAVGWHYSHRRSMELNFFSVDGRRSLEPVVTALTAAGGLVRAETNVSVALELHGVLVDVVKYPYAPLKQPPAGPGGFRVAAPLDLAVMKLAAIARRGLKRDFWDLHVLMTRGASGCPTS